MSSAALELQKTVFATLTGDAGLVAALGGPRVHDLAPANAPFPYVTFGRTSVQDWDTGTDSGSEHLFTLHVWSKARGKTETLEIMEMIRSALHDVDLALDQHRLVNLRLDFQEARFNEDLAVHHGIIRFRAVTEPAT
jgi:hypothetical protein